MAREENISMILMPEIVMHDRRSIAYSVGELKRSHLTSGVLLCDPRHIYQVMDEVRTLLFYWLQYIHSPASMHGARGEQKGYSPQSGNLGASPLGKKLTFRWAIFIHDNTFTYCTNYEYFLLI